MTRKITKGLAFASMLTAAAAMAFGAQAKTKPSPTPEPEPRPAVINTVSSYILLDRTGSMSSIWDEALTSVNAYVDSIGTDEEGNKVTDIKSAVTLAAFDYQNGFQFDVLREKVAPTGWTAVTSDEVNPRGMTPLFDAINRTITLAEADGPEKAVIVIMTDGHENSSKEVTREGAKAALERAEKRGWEVVFLGAEFSSFGDADAVGISASKRMGVGQGNLESTNRTLAKKAQAYARGDAEAIEFDEADRAEAGEEDLKARQGNR